MVRVVTVEEGDGTVTLHVLVANPERPVNGSGSRVSRRPWAARPAACGPVQPAAIAASLAVWVATCYRMCSGTGSPWATRRPGVSDEPRGGGGSVPADALSHATRVQLAPLLLTWVVVLAAEVPLMLLLGRTWHDAMLLAHVLLIVAFGAVFCLLPGSSRTRDHTPWPAARALRLSTGSSSTTPKTENDQPGACRASEKATKVTAAMVAGDLDTAFGGGRRATRTRPTGSASGCR